MSSLRVKRVFFLLNVPFATTILNLISHAHPASFLSRYANDSYNTLTSWCKSEYYMGMHVTLFKKPSHLIYTNPRLKLKKLTGTLCGYDTWLLVALYGSDAWLLDLYGSDTRLLVALCVWYIVTCFIWVWYMVTCFIWVWYMVTCYFMCLIYSYLFYMGLIHGYLLLYMGLVHSLSNIRKGNNRRSLGTESYD